MEIWDDISKTISGVAQSTVKGAEKLKGIAKIKYSIYLEQNKLENVYINIGKMYHEDPEGNLPTLKVQCGIADEISERLGKLKADLAEATNSSSCRFCGAKLGKEMLYCPICGKKQDEENKEENDPE